VFHDLRHCATSRLFERGLGLMEVAAITGHKTLAMLHRYTHLKAEDLALKLA
jgi:integrase